MLKVPYWVRKSSDYIQNLTLRRIVKIGVVLAGISITFIFILFLLVQTGALGSLPGKTELLAVKNPVASEVYSADSVLLGRYFYQERSDIDSSDIPQHVIDILIATEDVRFFSHSGVDMRSLGRVFIKSLLLQKESSGGGSTITQQLAKNLYPRKNYWFFSLLINKIREITIALRLERVYDKQSILTLYINTVPFGDNTFGLQTASQRFFSRSVRELSINEAAVLIGMLKASHGYNPKIFPAQSLKRRNLIISQLGKYKDLPEDLVDSLKSLSIELRYNKITHNDGLAPYFREHIRMELLDWCEAYNDTHTDNPINLYTDGLKIYTTIDSRLQRHAEEAMTLQMAKIQKTFLSHWGNKEPWQKFPGMLEEVIEKSEQYKRFKRRGTPRDSILKAMNTPVSMTVFTWNGEEEVMMSPIDSVKHYLKFLNAGVLALDPENGAVRVWVGGINHSYFQYDHVRESTKRQVGSIFKPIVYSAALEQGMQPCSFISAERTTYTNVENWDPKNSDDNYGLKYSMPGALAHSVNTVSVSILEKAGIENTIRLAGKMGISSKLDAVPSLALGTADISMIEMVSAYTCFANSGKVSKAFYITAITTSNKSILQQFEPAENKQVISKENAALMLYMLKKVVDKGTASSLRSGFTLKNDMGGKTGTTQSNTDGWFMAVTPKLIIGSWVGADDPRIRFQSTSLGQGARTALPLVGEFLKLSNADTSLNSITRAKFEKLPTSLERKIDCAPFRTEYPFFKKLFGKPNKKEFGEKKGGFFRRLFEK
jgi:penicillin-binding protein 1A